MQTSPATLRRWVQRGLIPQYEGEWTPTAVAHARLVARMRDRGHSLEQIRDAGETGRLAFGYLGEIFPSLECLYTLQAAADETGLEPALIERILRTMGLPVAATDRITEDDLELLRYGAAVLAAGLPLIAFLQLVRVYGQALAQLADAEVRLFHRLLAHFVDQDIIGHNASGPHLEFELIGEVRLKGFTEATELYVARQAPV